MEYICFLDEGSKYVPNGKVQSPADRPHSVHLGKNLVFTIWATDYGQGQPKFAVFGPKNGLLGVLAEFTTVLMGSAG